MKAGETEDRYDVGSDPDLHSLKSDGTWAYRPPSCSISDSIEKELNKLGLLTLSGENRGLALALVHKGSTSSRLGRVRKSILGLQFGDFGGGNAGGGDGPPYTARKRDSGTINQFANHRLSRSLEDFHPFLSSQPPTIPESVFEHPQQPRQPHPSSGCSPSSSSPTGPQNPLNPLVTSSFAASGSSASTPVQDFSHVKTFKDYQEAVVAKQRMMMFNASVKSKSQDNKRTSNMS